MHLLGDKNSTTQASVGGVSKSVREWTPTCGKGR